MLELTNVIKQFHTDTILEIPALMLEKGIYWLNGANGSGKTTLLKMIAAVLPFEGDISVNNTSLKKAPVHYRQQVSWAEAEPLYPDFMTGENLIGLYCKIRGVARRDADYLLGLLGMHGYIKKATGTYSAGMTKKLSLVLALLGNQPLIILDEPLITLDKNAVEITTNIIREKSETTATSFLMSSHHDLQDDTCITGKRLTIRNRTIIEDGLFA